MARMVQTPISICSWSWTTQRSLSGGTSWHLMVALRRASRNIAALQDILVTSVDDFDRNQNTPGTTEFEPAQHGVVVYERPAA